MNHLEQIRKESVQTLGSLLDKDEIDSFVNGEIWDSERELIGSYFSTGSKILDVACGPGRLSIPLSKRGNEVIGIDQTSELIDIARKVSLSTNLNLGYRIGRATNIKFQDDHFHFAIFANNGWGRIPGKEQRKLALLEISRVLRPGGILILCVHKRHYLGLSGIGWLFRFLKYYGFKVLGISLKEVDFGDVFLSKNKEGEQLRQKKFVHIAGSWELKSAIKGANFQIELVEKMAKISKRDKEKKRGALTKNFNSSKSPVFYVCKKIG